MTLSSSAPSRQRRRAATDAAQDVGRRAQARYVASGAGGPDSAAAIQRDAASVQSRAADAARRELPSAAGDSSSAIARRAASPARNVRAAPVAASSGSRRRR